MRVIHELIQGSDDWLRFRAQHFGASECAAMLGLSKTTTRTELLHIKHTGLGKEFSEWVQANILDHGHKVEALARPHIEDLIGHDLYAVTCSDGELSASCDGLTMDDRIAMEHKQWAEALAASVSAGIVPEEHLPQCQQILMVTKAERLIFVVSDGTPEKMVYAWVTPDPAWFSRIRAGWRQFAEDLAAYSPPARTPVAVVEAVEALPSVLVQVTGDIAIRHNFPAFEQRLRAFLETELVRDPKTDADFGKLDLQIKAMKGAEAALDAAESQMLAQIQTVDSAKKTKDMLAKLVRDNRLMAEKLLASEKERRRGEIVAGGVAALREHIDGLNQRLGRPYMPAVPADFGGVIKGMKSLASMEDKVATELARAKIAANEIADRLQINLAYLREHAGEHRALFPDTSAIIHKAPDDLQALVTARIAEHQAAEAKRLEAERERIRAEEAARLQREQEARAAEERRQQEADARAARQREEDAAREQLQREATTAPDPITQPAPASQAPAANVHQLPPKQSPPVSPPSLRLGQIGERLGFTVTAEFLGRLGFAPAAVDKAAKLFHEADFPRMCAAIEQHIAGIRAQHERRAA